MRIKGYTPEPWQMAVHNTLAEIERDQVPNAIVLCKSKRQCGKSLMATQIVLEYLLSSKREKSIIISPTLKQSRKLYKDINEGLRECRGVVLAANASLLEIYFCNGSILYFLSGEQKESLRGYTISKGGVLVIDEGAYIADDIFGIVAPFTNVFRRPMIVISTPRYCTGMFWQLWSSGEKNVYKIDWNEYDTSKYLSPEAMEMYKRTLPRSQYKMDYEGEFVSLSSDLFGDLSGVINDNPERNGEYYMGIDWAASKGNDYNAVVVFNSLGQMVECQQWNNTDESGTIDKILFLVGKWSPKKVTAEQNSMGNVFLSMLEKDLSGVCPVEPFLTTNESKNEIVALLQVAIQQKNVSLLNNEDLIAEMGAYAVEVTRSGKVTYNASVGHDDLVMATMIAFASIQRGEYFVS